MPVDVATDVTTVYGHDYGHYGHYGRRQCSKKVRDVLSMTADYAAQKPLLKVDVSVQVCGP